MAACFLLQEAAWAAPVASVGSPLTVPPPMAISQFVTNPSQIQMPLEHAMVQEIHAGTNGKLIIHIQDAHANLSGQQSLAKALDQLLTKYDLRLVLVEGSARDSSLDEIRKLAPLKEWSIIARRFLYEGIISGEEYLNLTTEHPMKIIGVEYRDLYDEAVKAYAAVVDRRKDILHYLYQAKISLDRLKVRMYPKELKDYEAGRAFDDSGSVDFKNGFSSLLKLAKLADYPLADLPQVGKLQGLMDKESLIAFDKANAEQAEVLKGLGERGAADEAKEFVEASRRTRFSQVSQYMLLSKLMQTAEQKQMALESFPELKAYTEYLSQFTDLKVDDLMTQMEYLEDKVYEKLLPDDNARKVRAIDRFLGLLGNAYKLQMSSRDFKMFTFNEKNFKTESWLAFMNRQLVDLGFFESLVPYKPLLEEARTDFGHFYQLVSERDGAFVQNAKRIMDEQHENAAVLIAGGYHTAHLTELLRAEGTSYIVLTPVVTDTTDHDRYEDLLLSHLKEQEKHLAATHTNKKDTAPYRAQNVATTKIPRGLRALAAVNGRLIEAASRMAPFLAAHRVNEINMAEAAHALLARPERTAKTSAARMADTAYGGQSIEDIMERIRELSDHRVDTVPEFEEHIGQFDALLDDVERQDALGQYEYNAANRNRAISKIFTAFGQFIQKSFGPHDNYDRIPDAYLGVAFPLLQRIYRGYDAIFKEIREHPDRRIWGNGFDLSSAASQNAHRAGLAVSGLEQRIQSLSHGRRPDSSHGSVGARMADAAVAPEVVYGLDKKGKQVKKPRLFDSKKAKEAAVMAGEYAGLLEKSLSSIRERLKPLETDKLLDASVPDPVEGKDRAVRDVLQNIWDEANRITTDLQDRRKQRAFGPMVLMNTLTLGAPATIFDVSNKVSTLQTSIDMWLHQGDARGIVSYEQMLRAITDLQEIIKDLRQYAAKPEGELVTLYGSAFINIGKKIDLSQAARMAEWYSVENAAIEHLKENLLELKKLIPDAEARERLVEWALRQLFPEQGSLRMDEPQLNLFIGGINSASPSELQAESHYAALVKYINKELDVREFDIPIIVNSLNVVAERVLWNLLMDTEAGRKILAAGVEEKRLVNGAAGADPASLAALLRGDARNSNPLQTIDDARYGQAVEDWIAAANAFMDEAPSAARMAHVTPTDVDAQVAAVKKLANTLAAQLYERLGKIRAAYEKVSGPDATSPAALATRPHDFNEITKEGIEIIRDITGRIELLPSSLGEAALLRTLTDDSVRRDLGLLAYARGLSGMARRATKISARAITGVDAGLAGEHDTKAALTAATADLKVMIENLERIAKWLRSVSKSDETTIMIEPDQLLITYVTLREDRRPTIGSAIKNGSQTSKVWSFLTEGLAFAFATNADKSDAGMKQLMGPATLRALEARYGEVMVPIEDAKAAAAVREIIRLRITPDSPREGADHPIDQIGELFGEAIGTMSRHSTVRVMHFVSADSLNGLDRDQRHLYDLMVAKLQKNDHEVIAVQTPEEAIRAIGDRQDGMMVNLALPVNMITAIHQGLSAAEGHTILQSVVQMPMPDAGGNWGAAFLAATQLAVMKQQALGDPTEVKKALQDPTGSIVPMTFFRSIVKSDASKLLPLVLSFVEDRAAWSDADSYYKTLGALVLTARLTEVLEQMKQAARMASTAA